MSPLVFSVASIGHNPNPHIIIYGVIYVRIQYYSKSTLKAASPSSFTT